MLKVWTSNLTSVIMLIRPLRSKTINLILTVIVCLWALMMIIHLQISSMEVEVVGWGYNTVRDPLQYINTTPLILPKNFCRKNSILLVIVPSKPSHARLRTAIRRSWASRRNLMRNNVSFYFLVGRTHFIIQRRLYGESRIFNDIIQEDFNDVYNNLSIKSLMMLKLATTRCRHVKYLLKADDDTLVKLDNIVDFLITNGTSRLLTGQVYHETIPLRIPGEKYYTPYYLYPYGIYPDYLKGSAYLMSMEVAKILYDVALQTPIMHFEDVYILGICAEKAGIQRTDSSLFTQARYKKNGGRECMKDFFILFDIASKHMMSLYVFYQWC